MEDSEEDEFVPPAESDSNEDEVPAKKRKTAKPKTSAAAPNGGTADTTNTERRLRNREAAHQFRQRQKMYILNLERQMSELTITAKELQNRLRVQTMTNEMLKEHVEFLRNFISKISKQKDTSGYLDDFPSYSLGLSSIENSLEEHPPIDAP